MTDSPSPEALAFAKKWCPYRERLHDMAKAVDDFARQAVERERKELLDCAQYDALMEGPKFKSWNLSRLNLLRQKYESEVKP